MISRVIPILSGFFKEAVILARDMGAKASSPT